MLPQLLNILTASRYLHAVPGLSLWIIPAQTVDIAGALTHKLVHPLSTERLDMTVIIALVREM